ncbi:MAG: metallophosphoesterase [Planctomycetes bacterium]|nr:metallophosphoesterase [Planctomycetota bacterium]
MFEPLLPDYPKLAATVLVCDVVTWLAAVVAFRIARPSHPLRELWVGGAAVGACAAVGGIVTSHLFGNGFAVLRLWSHLLTFVVAPLAVWRGLRRWRRGPRWAGVGMVGAGLLTLGASLWAHLVEPYRLEVTHYAIRSDALVGLPRPLRIAVLADIQTDAVGSYERDVFARVAAQQPDLVLMPGDFVQRGDRAGFVAEQAKLVELIESLAPPLGIYAVMGDVDPYEDLFAGTSIRVLRDEVVRVPGVPALRLAGLTLNGSREPLTPQRAFVDDGFEGFTIVMGHAPDAAIPLLERAWTADLLYVAGHTHGGQVVVPGFGPPLTLSHVPRRVAAGGLFPCGRAQVLVTRGIGHERGQAPRIRFFCRPELAIVELFGPEG